jgi:hypothetical protein
MKKVLVVFEGSRFASSSMSFAIHLNSIQNIMLAGIFLPQTDISSMWSRSPGAGTGSNFIPLMEEVDAEVIHRNIETFGKLCTQNKIDFTVHKDIMDLALPQLKSETRFADLLLIESETFYGNAAPDARNTYLYEALSQSECPIIVIPEHMVVPQSLVLAYDGSKSSVYALKQFAYLFPEMTSLPTLLVYVDGGEEDFPDKINIEELAARHFSNLSFLKLDMDPRKYFPTWLSEKKESMLVAGAFGRSALSRLFKPGFVADVIGEHTLPVFIAHT